MNTPSNEILDERFKTMEKQNKVEHWEIKDLLTTLSSKIDDLEKKYVTRLELKLLVYLITCFLMNFYFYK